MKSPPTRLGVNIDHVATLRQVRGTFYPDFLDAIRAAEAGGADGITMHLREDRRHVQDADVRLAREQVMTHLNLEMAATDEMIAVALDVKPDYCCLVPERREELTTEGGLDVITHAARIADACLKLRQAGIQVSLFIEPEPSVVDKAAEVGAAIVELHTGEYALARDARQQEQHARIDRAAAHAAALGLQVNAGHGLHRNNVHSVASIPVIAELNIGHAIVADAVFIGLESSVRAMRKAMNTAMEQRA